MADDKKKKPAGAKKSAAKSTAKRATTRKTQAKPAAKPSPKSAAKSATRKASTRKASTARKPAAAAKGTRRAAASSRAASGSAKSARTASDSSTGATGGATGHAAAATARVEDFGNAIDISNLAEKLWRGLSMIVFGIVGSWAYIALMVLASVQYIVVLFTDKPSQELSRYTATCRTYLGQVLNLLAYETEVLPWPLGPLPGKDD